MRKTGHRIASAPLVCLVLAIFLTAPTALFAADADQPAMAVPGGEAAVLRADMRKLWEDHIMYTRNVIISMAAGLPDLDVAVARLMQNQVDIGNAIRPYYGDAAGDKLTALLKVHIAGAADVVKAGKAGDAAKLADAQKAWYANADEIAVFLSSANPQNWPVEAVKGLMKTHLDTTTEEAVARLKGDWAADVAAFDKVHMHILMMSDALSMGIIQQFPAKFQEAATGAAAEAAAAPAPPTAKVSMADDDYDPQELRVPAGTTVIWTNAGLHPHTVTTDSAGGPVSAPIRPGQTYQWVVPADAAPGTKYFYHCRYHADRGDGKTMGRKMSGVVIVK